eukprot:Em0354g4a
MTQTLPVPPKGSASGPTLILNWIPSGGHPLNNGVIPFTTDLGQVGDDQDITVMHKASVEKVEVLYLPEARRLSPYVQRVSTPAGAFTAHSHAEEGSIKSVLTEDTLKTLMDAEGRITDEQFMKKIVFFKEIALNLRKEVWPFLLGVYSLVPLLLRETKQKKTC